MPELPEVETVKEALKKEVLNKTIKQVKLYYEPLIVYPNTALFKEKIKNETITDIKRRGKWLMIVLNHYYLLSHLRMEGRYFIRQTSDPIQKHELIAFDMTDDTSLRYLDTRKFGRMYLYKTSEVLEHKPLNELGLEPFSELLTSSYLMNKYEHKTIPIKTALLDQKIIVGIGNIYADEILFMSHLNPYLKANQLQPKDCEAIIINTRTILTAAIKAGGTTIRTYESAEGIHAKFQQNLLVHNKKDEP